MPGPLRNQTDDLAAAPSHKKKTGMELAKVVNKQPSSIEHEADGLSL